MRKYLRGAQRQISVVENAKFCGVAAALVGSAVVGYAASSSASGRAADAADKATAAGATATAQNSFIQQQQIDQSKREFDAAQTRNAKIDALTARVTDSQIASQDKQNALADEYANYNRTTFRPLEQGIVNEAENYDTPEAQAKAAGQASTDLAVQSAAARDASGRNLARMGIKPTDGRYAAAMGDPANEALGQVTAMNGARDKVKVLGAAKRMDAASLGRGLPSSQATSAGLALTAGNSAVGNQVSSNGSQASSGTLGASLLSGGAATGGGLASNAASIYGTTMNSANAAASGIGSAAGMLLNYYKPAAVQ